MNLEKIAATLTVLLENVLDEEKNNTRSSV